MEYIKETKHAYTEYHRAKTYDQHITRGFSWARFIMWREKQCVAEALQAIQLQPNDVILDLPCGTGILAAEILKWRLETIAGDISREMINLARERYGGQNFRGFLQVDITHIPLPANCLACTVVIGLMHRVPPEIRTKALKELARIAGQYIIISYSVDDFIQKAKKYLVKRVLGEKAVAPSPEKYKVIVQSFLDAGFGVCKVLKPVPFLSSEIIFLLVKRNHL